MARPYRVTALMGSPTTVEGVAVLPGGEVAVGTRGGVRVHDGGSSQLLRVLDTGPGQVLDVAVDRTGESIVAAVPEDGALVRVSTDDGQRLADARPEGPNGARGLAVAGLGDRVAVLLAFPGSGGVVEIRDTASLELLAGPVEAAAGTLDLAPSPDGRRLVVGTDDGRVLLLDARDPDAAPVTVSGDGDPVVAVAWGGDRLAAAREGGGIELWDLGAGGGPVRLATGAPVRRVAVSDDGRAVAAGTADGSVLAWRDPTDGSRPDVEAPGTHTGEVNDLAFRSGTEVVSGGYDRAAVVTRVDGGSAIAPLAWSGPGLTSSWPTSDGSVLVAIAAAGSGGVIRLDADGREVWRADLPLGAEEVVEVGGTVLTTQAAGPDGEPVTAVGLDAATGRRLWEEPLPESAAVVRLVGDPRGAWVLGADPATGVTSARRFAPGADRLGGPVEVAGDATAAAVLSDGRVVSAQYSGTVAVRDGGDLSVVAESATAIDDAYVSVAVDEAAGVVAVGGQSGRLSLYDLDTMAPVRPPVDAHAGRLTGLAFAAGMLVTAGEDGLARLWDPATWQPVGRPVPTGADLYPLVSAGPDGRSALVSGDAGVLALDVDRERWAVTACRAAGRVLSEAERRAHLDGEPAQGCRR